MSVSASQFNALANASAGSGAVVPCPFCLGISSSEIAAAEASFATSFLGHLKSRADAFLDVGFSALDDIYRAKNFVEVSAHMRSGAKVSAYVRTAPGAAPLAKAMGPQALNLFGAFVGVGAQALEDVNRDDLRASQKIGRASVALLGGVVAPVGLALVAGKILAPEATDRFLSDAFSARNPIVDGLADVIVRVGGKPFQDWSLKPSWVDFL